MGLKSTAKRVMLGKPGTRARRIGVGLLRGLDFNVDTASKSMRLLGLDEREIAGAVAAACEGATAALDIGAADGWYSLYFASRPNIRRVWAFEPEARLVDGIRDNFSLNDPAYAQKLQLEQKFVGDRDDEKCCRVDTILGDYDGGGPLVMKIDVEGAELAVLHGARRTLERHACRLVVEVHAEQLERDCLALLQGMNYQTRVISSAWYRLLLPEARVGPFNRWFVAQRA
jgi:hypothetical protein